MDEKSDKERQCVSSDPLVKTLRDMRHCDYQIPSKITWAIGSPRKISSTTTIPSVVEVVKGLSTVFSPSNRPLPTKNSMFYHGLTKGNKIL